MSDTLATTDTPELADTVAAPGEKRASDRTRIGRYQIVRRLGAGGMGVVFEATDPELGRGVAIKVMHDTSSLRLAERLRREAQALARLHHPNVVTVFDVGVDGELYIVMQLVSGVTLDRAIEGRSQRDVIALMVQAGRGLEAAHAAGIVHRDFKPTNVLVDTGGTVRVGDFGLARASDAADDAQPGGALELSMTRGDVVGTPAYMAPEQFKGGPVTPATDQFAFCVTLWEVLAGERPFPGEDFGSLRESVIGGKLREMSPRIPRRLRGVLSRGLAGDPKQRFASMSELLEALEPPRRTIWIASGVGLAAIVATLAFFGMRSTSDPCKTAGAPADTIWNDARRDAVRHNVGERAVATLDERTRWWKAKRIDVCQAGRNSDERIERRGMCLERNLADIGAAIETLTAPVDPATASRAAQIAAAGIDLDACYALADTPGPESAPATPRDDALYREVAQAQVDFEAGHYAAVVARAAALSPKVKATGDPGIAYAWFWHLGSAYDSLGKLALAKDAMREAAEATTRGESDVLATRAWSDLAAISATAGDLKTVDNVLAMARAAAGRSRDPRANAWVEIASARVAVERGAFADGVAACKRAQAIDAGLGVPADQSGKMIDVAAEALGCLVEAQIAANDPAAIASAKQLIDARTRDLGPTHPSTIEAMRLLATATTITGDTAGAEAQWDRVQAASEELYGKDSTPVMYVLRDRALAATPGGAVSTPKALANIQRAAALADKLLAPNDPEQAAILEALAYVEGAFRTSGAVSGPELARTYDRTIALYEKLDDPMGLARVLYNAGDSLRTQNPPDCEHAVPLFKRAAKVAGDTGQKSRIEAASLGAVGACLGAAKLWDDAERALEQAIAQLDAIGDPIFAAQNRWELADQLVKRGQTARGVALAKQAADQLQGQPEPASELRGEIVKWLARH